MPRFFGWLSLFAAGIFLFTLLNNLVAGWRQSGDYCWYIIAVVCWGCSAVYLLNDSPRIQLYPDGLRVQCLVFFWLWIPWKNITGIVEQKHAGAHMALVKARGLTVFHHLVTLRYGAGSGPGFNISSRVNDYERLLSTIRQKSPLLSEP